MGWTLLTTGGTTRVIETMMHGHSVAVRETREAPIPRSLDATTIRGGLIATVSRQTAPSIRVSHSHEI
jgi:hypothetical protein